MANYNAVNAANASTVASVYADPFERVTSATRSQNVVADQTQQTYSYTPTTVTTHSDLNTAGDGAILSEDVIDGLGRPAQHLDAFGGGFITVTRTYDALGRAFQVSNPYQSNTEAPNYSSTYYDALDRVAQVVSADGSTVSMSYSNNAVTVADAAGKSRASVYDALGRLTSVTEDPGGLNAVTSYGYDAQDELVSVTQAGLSTACGTTRSFQYDWARRLLSACNPESGTVTWAYDTNGNPQTRTDARGVVTTYLWDFLSRPIGKSYSGTAGAPAVTYTWDAAGVSNSIGRMTQASSSAATSSVLSYDTLGRVTSTSQVTNGVTYTFGNYTYNRAGIMQKMVYPSGRVVASGDFDALGRAGSVSSGSTTYASGVQYASHGAVKSLTLGNGLAETTNWNMARLQPASITAGGLWSASFYYCAAHAANCAGNNGNLLEQDFTVQGTSYVQTYTYDALNRISAVGEVNASNGNSFDWSQTFGYDNFGNRAVTAASGNGTVNPVWTPTAISQFTSTNQFKRDAGPSGADKYDAAGNQISVASSAAQPDVAANAMTYDAENRMVSANIGNTGAVNYTYDGDGRRVMKSIPATGATTVYVYDGAGQLAAEYSTVAPVISGTIYLTVDHLGSTRLVTNAGGAAVRCDDFMPFGEDVPAGVGARGSCWGSGLYPASPDVVSEKFTGKERDSESGLDYFGARYMSSAQGRFTSPDAPFNDQDPSNPQSWNLYSYVRNNPLVNTDPTGQDCVTTSNQTDTSITVSVAAGSCGKQGGTFVNGTVDTNSLTYNGKSLDFGYTGYDGSAGAFSKNLGAPVYEFPGIEGPANQAGAAHIAGSQALINEFAKQAAFQALGGIAGHFIGAGIDAALAARAGASAATPAAELTAHAAQRLAQRGITRAMVEEAVETAQQTGAIKSNVGQYGTIQHVYQGTNGISVVVETEGRNADKVVTAFRTGSKP